MWKVYLLCIFLLSVALPLLAERDRASSSSSNSSSSKNKKHEHDPAWSQGNHRRLFARRRLSPLQGDHLPKRVKAPARRCSRLMEHCSFHEPCCDPCASCRCRLFNTICHCWRLGSQCSKKT